MKYANTPEVLLALTVLELVVADLQSEDRKVRGRALEDVAAGGVDYWIDVVAIDLDVSDALRARIGLLAECELPSSPRPRSHVAA